MKKLKQFLFIFVPLLLVIAIQFLATYFAMGLSLLIESGWYSVTGSAGFLDIVDDAFSLWSSQRFNTGVCRSPCSVCGTTAGTAAITAPLCARRFIPLQSQASSC